MKRHPTLLVALAAIAWWQVTPAAAATCFVNEERVTGYSCDSSSPDRSADFSIKCTEIRSIVQVPVTCPPQPPTGGWSYVNQTYPPKDRRADNCPGNIANGVSCPTLGATCQQFKGWHGHARVKQDNWICR